jgi:hypothetical protein
LLDRPHLWLDGIFNLFKQVEGLACNSGHVDVAAYRLQLEKAKVSAATAGQKIKPEKRHGTRLSSHGQEAHGGK